MDRAFSLIYGDGWLDGRLLAIDKLMTLHVDNPGNLPCLSPGTDGGSLNYRCEIRDLSNISRLRAKVDIPTFEQLKLICMTEVQSAGLTVPQKRNDFDLDDPSGYFRPDIVRMVLGGNGLISWPQYHGARIPRVGSVPIRWGMLGFPAHLWRLPRVESPVLLRRKRTAGDGFVGTTIRILGVPILRALGPANITKLRLPYSGRENRTGQTTRV